MLYALEWSVQAWMTEDGDSKLNERATNSDCGRTNNNVMSNFNEMPYGFWQCFLMCCKLIQHEKYLGIQCDLRLIKWIIWKTIIKNKYFATGKNVSTFLCFYKRQRLLGDASKWKYVTHSIKKKKQKHQCEFYLSFRLIKRNGFSLIIKQHLTFGVELIIIK